MCPRPNSIDEIYINNNKTTEFTTYIGKNPPYSNSIYKVIERDNSSPKYIRATLINPPINQYYLNQSNLLFGLNIQPFRDNLEEEIPIVEIKENIFRCKKCKSYINNKYTQSYNQLNQLIFICNLCNNENIISSFENSVKEEYLNISERDNCIELTKPTIDFYLNEKNNADNKNFYPHYIFMIDISEDSFEFGLPNYILNSIQSNLDSFDNINYTYISISLYDVKNIYFFYLEKNEIKISIMTDLNNPFCPIESKKMYLNIEKNKNEIYKLIEKVINFINEKNSNLISGNILKTKNFLQKSVPTGAAIKSGIDSLLFNGGRILIFTPNPCNHGFNNCIIENNNEKKEENCFLPKHNKFNNLIEICNNNKITIDQFIFMSTQYDLSTMGLISNLTGGQIFYYEYTSNSNLINYSFEKLHYDINRVISRKNYYDVKFMIRYSSYVDCVEILSNFNRKLGEAFQLGSCDPDFNFYYSFKLNDGIKDKTKIHFQIACLFIDNYNKKYIRIFNVTYQASNSFYEIFNNIDNDSLVKAFLMKSISLSYRSSLEKSRDFLENKLYEIFKFYKQNVIEDRANEDFIYPHSLKFFPLYIHSFLKRRCLNYPPKGSNYVKNVYLLNKIMREPLYKTLKLLYPKMYRIDNIQKVKLDDNTLFSFYDIGTFINDYNIYLKPNLLRLSKDIIDMDKSYLIDDGDYINLFIFDKLNSEFYYNLFNMKTFEEIKENNILSLDEENQNYLNLRLLNIIYQLRIENNGYNQPVRIFLYNEKNIYDNNLLYLLIEDKIGSEKSYSDFLFNLNNSIQKSNF